MDMHPTIADLPRLLVADEIARLLRISRRQVSRLVAARRLPVVRIAGSRSPRFRLCDIEAACIASSEAPNHD